MKNAKKFYYQVLLPACLIFTFLCFAFSLILQFSESEMKLPMVNLDNLSQIFLFSFLFSASWQLFSIKKLPFWLTLSLHFLGFLANIAIVFFFIGKHYTTARNAFVILIIFALIYIVLAVIGVTIRHFILANTAEKKVYKRQF